MARWRAPLQLLAALAADPVRSARTAGLQYVCDGRPGIVRRRAGLGFSYVAPGGTRVRKASQLRRIRALAIPPAWTAVWVCPRPLGHIQATGRDAKNRKQYRYHARWRELRDEVKYGRLAAFGAALPLIRKRTAHDLTLSGMPRAKVVATVIQLLERTLIRVGNEEYARRNASYGLTTLRERHVTVEGGHPRAPEGGSRARRSASRDGAGHEHTPGRPGLEVPAAPCGIATAYRHLATSHKEVSHQVRARMAAGYSDTDSHRHLSGGSLLT